MRNRFSSFLAIGLVCQAVFLSGCGGIGKDSPGVTVSATITPTYNGVNTPSVDAFRNICTDPTGTSQLEYFADHTATASINANLINPSNIVNHLTVYIDSYTINFQSSGGDSPGAPPIQSDTRNQSISFVVSSATPTVAATMTVELVDLIRKKTYYNDVSAGTNYLNNYTAMYTFVGHSENGVPFTFTAQTYFQIGSFNNCPAGFQPTGVQPL